MLPLPFDQAGVRAGFPSPAQDYLEGAMDLNEELVLHPASTYYGRVKGDSLIDAGISDNDLLVIDKSLEPRRNDLAVCCLDGEFTLKFIDKRPDGIWLVPANQNYRPIRVAEGSDFAVWGVVTHTIKTYRGKKRLS